MLCTQARALGLPAEAAVALDVDSDEEEEGEGAAGWADAKIMDYFRLQQQKMAAFAAGRHQRLGAASLILHLNDEALLTIADEVQGVWSLKKLWSRDAEGKRQLGGAESAGVEGEVASSEEDM
jgi:hypothetical protein